MSKYICRILVIIIFAGFLIWGISNWYKDYSEQAEQKAAQAAMEEKAQEWENTQAETIYD